MTPESSVNTSGRDAAGETRLPALEAGDRLDQKTFHDRYEAMPPQVKAELIGGIVHMPSPLKPRHGLAHADVMLWLGLYASETPGVDPYDNTTAILSEESEPQPDAYLIITPEAGGQMHRNIDEYLVGAPELIVEVASSTESIDLHAKRRDYEQAGVREYVIVALRPARVLWFQLREGRFVELAPSEGVHRSQVFPGLWLDAEALLRRDLKRVRQVLELGLVSAEHAAFVALLAERVKGAS